MTDQAHCKSCSALIEWALTTKGRRVPLDVDTRTDGNVRLVDGIAHVVTKGLGDRVSHFVTCPESAQHRRRRGGRHAAAPERPRR